MLSQKILFTMIGWLLLANSANALFVPLRYVPVDRLLANTKAYIRENPGNHEGYYALARVHYLAFVTKSDNVATLPSSTLLKQTPAPEWRLPSYQKSESPAKMLRRLIADDPRVEKRLLKEFGYDSVKQMSYDERIAFREAVRKETIRLMDERIKQRPRKPVDEDIIEFRKQQQKERERKNQAMLAKHGYAYQPLPSKNITHKQLTEHAKRAVQNFKKAIELDPTNGLYALGLASLYEQYLDYKQQTSINDISAELASITLPSTRSRYYEAYLLAIKKEAGSETKPLGGLRTLVSYEAGKAYVELAKGDEDITAAEAYIVDNIKQQLVRFQDLERSRMITPIILTLQKHTSLTDLLDPKETVVFDLDGDGIAEQWPWVKVTTGFLVWDPAQTGCIVSGLQLFGSVSWWMFYPNGYFALDALDNDRDGYLLDAELKGIFVWFDTDANGHSDPGEVIPLDVLGIRALGTRPTGDDNGAPMHERGMIMENGTHRPTYDWITSPIRPRNDYQYTAIDPTPD